MQSIRSYLPRLEKHSSLQFMVLVFGLALLVRFYRLAYFPLWLDEIYGYELGHLGIAGIFRNSLNDPHPPLYYMIQWIAAGFGSVHHEVAWRWLPALSGAFTVAIVYQLARMQASPISAALVGVLFAFSPMHLYFSQEARSFAFVTLLSAVSMLLLEYLQQSSQNRGLWVSHFSVSLLGIYCSYSYVLVISMQLLYLVMVERRRQTVMRYALLFGVCCLPLVVPFWITLSSVTVEHATTPRTSFLQIVQAILGGDPVRYGFSWAHSWLLGITALLVGIGVYSRRTSGSRTLTMYYTTQCVLPFLLFFGVLVPLFKINLILTEAKQFMLLLPAWFVLVARGIEYVRYTGSLKILQSILVVLYAVTLFASTERIQRYWEVSKSPEGLIVREIERHMQADDVIVSLHYSLNAALSFYMPDTRTFAYPQQDKASYLFRYMNDDIDPKQDQVIHLETVRSHQRIWLLTHPSNAQEVIQAITHGCSIDQEWNYSPFHLTLLRNCV